ncbi:MAG TPA: GNAT family N-acetyltransferase [Trebonia sp.]|jgi:GNAT superfamily N-acetyltransferase|nr:GNAT family N-acetyltransferase [Trebonia sp.]
MADPLVRSAESGDVACIALVHVTSWQDAYRGHMPQDFLDGLDVGHRTEAWRRRLPAAQRSRGDVLVVESAGQVAGFAGFGPSRDADADSGQTGELAAIYLRPGSIGQGLGRLLMMAVVSGLTDLGYADATLWVLDGNARARRFYERAGWTLDGADTTDDSRGFTIREVRYRRRLP